MRFESVTGGPGIGVTRSDDGLIISKLTDDTILAQIHATVAANKYEMKEIDEAGNVLQYKYWAGNQSYVGDRPHFYAWEVNIVAGIANGTKVLCFPLRNGRYGFFLSGNLVRFASSCKIDNTPANRGMAYPGNTTIVNQRTVALSGGGAGPPDLNTEELLLVKFAQPVNIANGMFLHLVMNHFVQWTGGAGVGENCRWVWNYRWITADFNTAATTWNTQPASVGTGSQGYEESGGAFDAFFPFELNNNNWGTFYSSCQEPNDGAYTNHPLAYGVMIDPRVPGGGWHGQNFPGGLTDCTATTSIDPLHAHSFIAW